MGNPSQNQPDDPAPLIATPAVHKALYQSLLQNPTLGFWMLDENGRFLTVNDTYLRVSDYTRQELMGKHISDVEAPDVKMGMAVHLPIVKEQGHSQFESVHRTKDGTLWPVEVNATCADGHYFAVIQEITHRKIVESELKQKSVALENSLNGFNIINEEGNFLYANRAYLKMWGYDSLDEIIGTSPVEHCADPNIPAQIIQNLETQKSYALTFTAKRKNGSTFEVTMAAQKMVDDDGVVTYEGTSLDISALVEVRQKLHTERTRLRSLLDTIPDLVWLKDSEGHFLVSNPAVERLLGVSEAEMLGKTDYDLFEPDLADIFRQNDLNAIAAGEPQINEEWLTYAEDGRTILAETIKTSIRDEEGKILGVLGIARDITARHVAQQRIEESQQRYKTLAELTTDYAGSFWLDENGRVRPEWITGNLQEITGYTAEELDTQGGLFTIMHPDDQPRAQTNMAKMLQGESFWDEYRIITKDGQVRWLQDKTYTELDPQTGQPVRFYVASRDITERKNTEEALRKSEAQLAGIFTSTMDAIVSLDENQKIVFFNQAAEQMFGYTTAEILEKDHNLLIPPSFRKNHNLHIAMFDQSEQKQRQMGGDITLTGLRANGEEFPIEASISRVKVGEKTFYTAILRDITERKEAEQALRNSEERLELALKGADLGLWDWNFPDHVTFNKRWAEMLGFTLADLEPSVSTWENLIHPDDLPGVRKLLNAHLDGRTAAYESVHRLRTKVGTWKWILDRGRVLKQNEAGQPLRMVGTHLDITERKRAEDALQESEERLQLFIAHAPAALAMFDQEMRYLAISHRWLADYGLEKQEIVGHSHYDVFPEVPDWWKAIHQRGLAGEIIRADEDPFVRLDGNTQWLRWEVRPWYTPQGSVGGIVIFSEDITARKEAETAVQQIRSVLAEAEAIAKSGSWKFDILAQKSTWSEGIYDIFGIDRQTFTGDTYEAIQARVHPDNLEKANEAAIATFEHYQPNAFESRLLLPDGSERIIWVDSRVQQDENGRAVAMIGYIQDITERKQAEEKIEELQQILSRAETIAKIGSWKWDMSTQALTWSAEMYTLFGVDPANTELDFSQVIQERIHPDDQAAVEQANASVMNTHKPMPLEYRLVLPDGTKRVVWAEGRLVHNEAGQPTTLVGYVQDITERKEAVEALHQSEERFSKAFHLSPAALSLTREDGTIMDVNENYERITGYSREELIHQDATKLNIFTAEQRAELRQRMAVTGNRLREAELTIRNKSGERRHVLYSVEAINIKGEPCALTLAFDITQRKQMQLDLQEMANNMASAQAMTQSGSWEVHLTPDSELIEPHIWSDECFRIFGLEPDSTPITGERYYELVHPEDRANVRNIINQLVQTKDEVEYEYRLIRPDGTVRTVLDRVMLVEDEKTRQPIKLIGLVQDITKRKRAEETIAQLNQRMELILNSAGEGIYGADSDGRITFINPAMAHMLGQEPADLHGQDAHAMFHHSHLDGTPYPVDTCVIRTAVQNGEARHNQSGVFWHKDNTPVFVEYTTTPIYHNNEVVGSVTMVRDVTQRKQAAEEQAILEEQLRQSQKMESIGRLAGGVAHDFNNQLAIIKLYGDLMRHGMNKQDPLLPKLEQIRQAVDRAANLTRQLLAFSRKQVLQPNVLNINDLVTNLEKMLGRLIGEDIDLSTNLQPNLWHIMADTGQMNQVIMNLIVNARDAMPTGGLITIETHNVHNIKPTIHPHQDIPEGPCVLLTITDTGLGMDAVTRKQIFEPFFTTKQPGQGTGLGLATVHGIIKQSGGTIYVYSEPEQGTTFKIYLPTSQEAREKLAAMSDSGTVQTGSETILLVEDEPALCDLIQETLMEIGYTVLASKNGGEALAIAQANPTPINLLLTDVVLPHMSGQEVAEKLTAVQPHTKVLFISGYMDDAVIRHGVLSAEVNFLSKPFSRSVLATKVREVLDIRT